MNAQDLAGRASVIDGDTREVQGQRIRLHGIDAPESEQICKRPSGEVWRCGQRAALAWTDRIGAQTVTCTARDRDRYGRIVAVCGAGGDLNAFCESFNGKFRAECLNASWFLSLEDARSKCEAWREDYNEVRPHSAIGNKPPIALLSGSCGQLPA